MRVSVTVLLLTLGIFWGGISLFGQERQQLPEKKRDLFKPLVTKTKQVHEILVSLSGRKVFVDKRQLKEGQQVGVVYFLKRTEQEILLSIAGVLCRIELDNKKPGNSTGETKTKKEQE